MQEVGSLAVTLPPMRVSFEYPIINMGSHVTYAAEQLRQDPVLVPLSRKIAGKRRKTFDPFRLRKAFELVDTPRSALEFLEVCGPFRDYAVPQVIPYEEFKAWQAYMTSRLQRRFNAELPRYPVPPESATYLLEQPFLELKHAQVSQGAVPNLSITCRTALEMIFASIFLDLFRGSDFVPCKLHGCPGTVERGIREYCNDTCKNTAKQRGKRTRRRNDAEAAQ